MPWFHLISLASDFPIRKSVCTAAPFASGFLLPKGDFNCSVFIHEHVQPATLKILKSLVAMHHGHPRTRLNNWLPRHTATVYNSVGCIWLHGIKWPAFAWKPSRSSLAPHTASIPPSSGPGRLCSQRRQLPLFDCHRPSIRIFEITG